MGPPSSDGFEICETPPVPRRPPPATLSQPSQTDPPSSSPDVPLLSSSHAPSSALSSIKFPSYRLPPRLQPVAGPSRAGPVGVGRGGGAGQAGVLELGSSDEESGVEVDKRREDEIEIVSYRAASGHSIAHPDNSSDDLPPPDQLGLGPAPGPPTFRRAPPHLPARLIPSASVLPKTTAAAFASASAVPLPWFHSTASELRPSAVLGASAYSVAQKGKGRASAASLEVLADTDSDGSDLDPHEAVMAPKRKQPPSAGRFAGVARGASESILSAGGPPLKKKASTASAPDKASTKQAATDARTSKVQAKANSAAYAKAHRAANTIQSDRKKTVAELTCHIDGLGLRPLPGPGDPPPLPGQAAFSLPLKRGAKAKPSVWPEIAAGLSARMGPYSCRVEVGAEQGRKQGHDLRSEGAVRWTRVCDRRWDDGRAEFVPLGQGNEVVVEEDSRLIFMTALELSSLIARDELESHIATVQTLLPPHVHLFLMVSGLGALFAKMRSAKNKQYKDGVLGDSDSPAAPANIGIGGGQPDKDTVEVELVKLETAQRVFLIRVESGAEAVEWLEQLTFDVGFKPHARHRFLHAAALGGSGDDKLSSGRDLEDTWIKMLATLKAVTEPLAKAIVAQYPTVRDLHEAWAACATDKERKELLAGIRKGNKVNGAATDRTLGKATSEKIYNFFTAKDGDQPLN